MRPSPAPTKRAAARTGSCGPATYFRPNVEHWTETDVPLTESQIGRFVMLTGDGAPVARFASAAIAVVIVIGLAVIVVANLW